jgi:DNA-binding NarL/FixJ family response regulator
VVKRRLRHIAHKSGQFDLVVMDLGMPGMGGEKALRAILEINPKAKVLIASGYAANEQVKMAHGCRSCGLRCQAFQSGGIVD